MKKLIVMIFGFIAVMVPIAKAQSRAVHAFCEDGGVVVTLAGLLSTNLVQASYPKCTVAVYLTGTTNLATITANAQGTPLGNPFTANVDGSITFYAPVGVGYDIVLSGGSPIPFPKPFTLADVFSGDSGGGGGGSVTSFSAGNLTPLFNTFVANSTTAPALTFTALQVNQNFFLAGPATGGFGPYAFRGIAPSDLPVGTNSTLGALKCDGTTTTCSGGTITAVGGSGCGVLCVLLNPTTAQTITQADTTSFTFIQSNVSSAFNINNAVSVITPGGNGGTSANDGVIITNIISGFGRNNGNGVGINCNLNDCGWNVQVGTGVAITDYKDGIMGGLTIDSIHEAAGDTNSLTINPRCPGGNEDASGEGCRVFAITGSGVSNFYNGTIGITQTGSTTPILAGGSMASGSFIINASKPKLTNTLAGTPAIWDDGSGGNSSNILSDPIGGSGVVTPGICKTTAYMQGDNYLNENPVTRTITCNIINGKALTNGGGPVWQVSTGVAPERVTISSVTTSGSTQTLSVTGRKPAAVGSYFFQGGTNGVIVYADDVARANVYTAYYIFGAVDSTHLLFGFFDQGQMNRSDPIQTHSVAETYTSAFTVYDAARISSLDAGGQNPVLEPNTVPFVIGDIAYALPNPAYNETLMKVISTAFAPADSSDGSKGILITMDGQGETYSGNSYHPFEISANIPLGRYNCTGCGGWLDAPPAMVVTTDQSRLPFSEILVFGQPVDATSGVFGGGCAGGTVLCNLNDPTHNFLLYAETNSGRNIEIDNATATVDFNQFDGILANSVILTSAGTGGIRFPGAADGTYLRCRTGGICTPNTIAATDLPLATNASVGVVEPDNTSITVASGGILSATPAPTATSSILGLVRPDNTTVTISGGVLSATPAAGGVTSLNSITGGVTLTGSGGVTITPSGSTINISTSTSTATDYYWTQQVNSCSIGLTAGATCTGNINLPGAMPDASYQLICSDASLALGLGAGFTFQTTTLPTGSGSTINVTFANANTVSGSGTWTPTLMCHAHHS